jgi:hypothetical protein
MHAYSLALLVPHGVLADWWVPSTYPTLLVAGITDVPTPSRTTVSTYLVATYFIIRVAQLVLLSSRCTIRTKRRVR